jgi:hypothetical protein
MPLACNHLLKSFLVVVLTIETQGMCEENEMNNNYSIPFLRCFNFLDWFGGLLLSPLSHC